MIFKCKSLARLGSIAAMSMLSFLPLSDAYAQRKTDLLDRGLVAVKQSTGVFLSWRIQADEYYDVKYNVYRDGALIAQNLNVSNYTDAGGSLSSRYTVAPVRKGIVGAQCAASTTWANQYFEFPVANIQDRSGVTVWKQNDPSSAMANYTINDISLGDVDGDGKIDFIVKRKNQTDQDQLFPISNKQMFCQIEVYASTINYGRLWWIDCGPNICYGSDEQWDAVAFDWNEDGACEVLYRGGANTVIHHSDGSTETIGNVNENIRNNISHTANMTFANSGEEWLMYINGRTGRTYDVISYPLPRGNASDWGDSYGHRSSKYFMGAPYLDGVNPYIFLGRGIYTKTDACTYRVNKSTNKLYKVGNTWHSYNNSGWFGQGNHNFAIADTDEDGSDEIIYGSMVLDFHTDDMSLHGCSSTSLGHGDASHTGDLDPFRRGLETFACNEDNGGNNYRNATTCEIYYRHKSSGDDGRAIAGNFTNDYPGSIGMSSTSGVISLASDKVIDECANNWNANTPSPAALNFRIYWDGDLLDESVNGPGASEGYLYIDKNGRRIYDTSHGSYQTACINWTKKNPCAAGDILGDWREELVMRTTDNRFIRVYTTVTPTENRIQSLWYDHVYRQGMVWQTEGYNQPAHTSYFVGELEGLTQAPPAQTWTGRTGIGNRGSITTALNGKDVFVWPDGNGSEYTVNINNGAQPFTLYLNSRTTVEGGDRVNYTETKHTWDRIFLTGNGLSGSTNLCKQGASAAHLPYTTHTHTGRTDVWSGALICNGGISNSPIYAYLHTELFLGNSLDAEESHYKSIEMEYGSALYMSSQAKTTPLVNDNGYAHMSVGTLSVHEGSRVVFDINGTDNANGDKLDIGTLKIRKQDWKYGPRYLAPVFQFNSSSALGAGKYRLGTIGNIQGNLDNIIIEGNISTSGNLTKSLVVEDGVLYLKISGSGYGYERVYFQDFESASTNNYGFYVAASSVEAMTQANGHGGKVFHIYQGATNNRTINLDFNDNPYFTNATSYTFEFDVAIISGNQNQSSIIVNGGNGVLCSIDFGSYATSATVKNGSGTSLGTIGCEGYSRSTINAGIVPSEWYHFKLVGSSRGVHLTVTNADGQTVINNAQLNSYTTSILSINNNLGRYHTHIAYDNISLISLISYDLKTRAALDGGSLNKRSNTGIENVADNADAKTPVAYFTIEGRKVAQPESGKFYIVKMKDGSTKKMIMR